MRKGAHVYVDEAGGPEPEDQTAPEHDGEVTVTVDGEDYHAEANMDVNDDGTNESIVQKTGSGYNQFSDSDGDGQADLYVERDADGKVVSAARFDPSTGEWTAIDPSTGEPTGGTQTDTSSGDTAGAGEMTVDTGSGERSVGEPTVDTTGDGTKDTAVVNHQDGGMTAYTDADGDGEADLRQEIDAQGNVVISKHAGDGQWEEVERGRIDEQGEYQRQGSGLGAASDSLWGDGDDQSAGQGAARIDSTTGQWISAN